MSNTYGYEEVCENCDARNTYEIPKGKAVRDFMRGQLCWNCGCPVDPSIPTLGKWKGAK